MLFDVFVLQAVLQQSDSVTDRLREENEILKAQVWHFKVAEHGLIDVLELLFFVCVLFNNCFYLPFAFYNLHEKHECMY